MTIFHSEVKHYIVYLVSIHIATKFWVSSFYRVIGFRFEKINRSVIMRILPSHCHKLSSYQLEVLSITFDRIHIIHLSFRSRHYFSITESCYFVTDGTSKYWDASGFQIQKNVYRHQNFPSLVTTRVATGTNLSLNFIWLQKLR